VLVLWLTGDVVAASGLEWGIASACRPCMVDFCYQMSGIHLSVRLYILVVLTMTTSPYPERKEEVLSNYHFEIFMFLQQLCPTGKMHMLLFSYSLHLDANGATNLFFFVSEANIPNFSSKLHRTKKIQ
jgi:hypothetical protein